MFPSLQAKLKRFEELEAQLQDPAVLADTQRLLAVQREYGGLAKVAKLVRAYNELEENIQAAREMLEEETDPEAQDYARAELAELIEQQQQMQRQLEDIVAAGDSITRGGLIMEIRAGTGGEEAALFARDLLNMYLKFVERRGWKSEIIEMHPTDLGGLREVVFSITGEEAYHQLQFESGGHRVQRVPETEAQG
ncbi:MAG: PCRF domain-containing protein, partial [Planctomycetes bacterium]|nr:PCRF domain-containing protein [Planctomycetota bacterium]